MAKTPYTPTEFFRPLVSGWLGKIEIARRARQPWAEMAKECEAFFCEPTGFMWDLKYGGKFWSKSVEPPKFQLTLSKAFEFVALYAPVLWANVPHRTVTPKRSIEIPPEWFQLQQQSLQMRLQGQTQQMAMMGPQGQQMAQQFMQGQMQQLQQQFQQMQQVQLQDKMETDLRAKLMESWLNYTAREANLEQHGEKAVVDALLKGRGVLWPRPHKMPGSDKTLTGCFWKTVDDLFIDPDAQTVEEAQWIALRWVQPWHVVEERFGLPNGSLRQNSTLESAYSHGSRMDDPLAHSKRASGQTSDQVEYYEIWSKCGAGARLTGMDSDVGQHLEKTVGKYAYIVVAPDVPYPLNAPTERVRGGAADHQVQAMFSWPVPTWTDNRWPMGLLDFYSKPNCLWPIPPLAPGLGELKFLNIMASFLCNRIWSSSRDFIAVAKHAMAEVAPILESGKDLSLIPINHQSTGRISDLVEFLQHPQTNLDVWRVIEAMTESFERRVGLNDLLYGLNPGGTNPRTAEEVNAKRSAISVRPDYMAKKVEQWGGEIASIEAFCARFFVTGESVEPLMGAFGRQMWEELVMSSDVEKVVREMSYTVAAGSSRRPNKDRDVANINQFLNTFGPMLTQHAMQTGQTQAVNGAIQLWGKASDMDVTDLMMSPPPPPPGQEQMMQAQIQMMQQEQQMELQKQQAELQMDSQRHGQEMQQDQQQHQQEMQQDREEAQLKMQLETAKAQIQGQVAVQKAEQQAQIQQRQADLQLQRTAATPLPDPNGGKDKKKPSSNGQKKSQAA